MSLAVLLGDLPELLVERVIIGEESITFVARLIHAARSCPSCAQPAIRVHSRSHRVLQDLPASGRRVQVSLQVRRFFCLNPTCRRRTFTEQLLRLATPHAQKTARLKHTLCQIGFALGGEAGARLVRDLGMPCSPDTLLRLVRQQPLPVRRPHGCLVSMTGRFAGATCLAPFSSIWSGNVPWTSCLTGERRPWLLG